MTTVRRRSSRPARPVPAFGARAGAAITSDGRLLVETGDGPYDVGTNLFADWVISLSPKDLNLTDYYTPANRVWITAVDMSVPTPVVVANGMAFAMADGDYAPQFGSGGNLLNTQERLAKTGRRTVYVMDAATGLLDIPVLLANDVIHESAIRVSGLPRGGNFRLDHAGSGGCRRG